MNELFYSALTYFIVFYFVINILASLLNVFLIKTIYDINPQLMREKIYLIAAFTTNDELSKKDILKRKADSFWSIMSSCFTGIFDLYSSFLCIKKLFTIWNNSELNYILSNFNWNYNFIYSKNNYYQHQFLYQDKIEITITRIYNAMKVGYISLLGNTKIIDDRIYIDIKSNGMMNICSKSTKLLLADYFYQFYENNRDFELKEYFEKNSFDNLEKIKNRYPKIILWVYNKWGRYIKESPELFIDISPKSEFYNLKRLIENHKKQSFLLKEL